MKAELSPEMHYELMKGKCSHLEIQIMKASVLMRQGMSKEEALSKSGISELQFDDNYSKVFPGSTLETLKKFIEIAKEERESQG